MRSFTAVTLACLAISVHGAPQFYKSYGFKPVDNPERTVRNVAAAPLFSFKSTNNYDSFGIPTSGDFIKDVPNQGASWDTKFGKIPFAGKNFMSREQRAQWLPIMKALLKVMETSRPDSRDVNTLLVMSRDLMKDQPQSAKLFNSFGGGFGLEGIQGMGLPETGDVINEIDGVPHIITEFGSFPLSETSIMTNEERERFLPVSRTFTSVLEKDTLDIAEMNLLLKQSRELTEELKKLGEENGISGDGPFGALGALASRGATPLRSSNGGSSNTFSEFGTPTSGDSIINVPGQGASFNTAFGKFPLGKNRMSAEERAQWLPIMEVLVRVMETDTPAPEDVNELLVKSRDLSKYNTPGFTAFEGLEDIKQMGLPETGDVVKDVQGEPHIMTSFGAFPLSDLSLMTDEERAQYLPATRTFLSVLKKDTLNADEMNLLLSQSRDLISLVPSNFLQQFSNGFSGLGSR